MAEVRRLRQRVGDVTQFAAQVASWYREDAERITRLEEEVESLLDTGELARPTLSMEGGNGPRGLAR